MVSGPRSRLQDLEARASRGELDARNVELQSEQIRMIEDALRYERARGEKQAEAVVTLARVYDNRLSEQGAQFKDTTTKIEAAYNADLATRCDN
jgi:hypothetical protein